MLERIASPTERWHLFSAVRQFLGWARKQKLIDHNPCDDLDADDRPDKPRSRDNVPTLAILRAVWDAVESEPAHARDLHRFLTIVPLRRSEAATLTWANVDLAEKRISIRMKTGERHELPLSPSAIDLLAGRKQSAGLVFGTAAGKIYTDWGGAIGRIRKKIGQVSATKETRFTWHDVRRGFVSGSGGTVRRRPPRPVPRPHPQRRVRGLPEISPLARAGGRAERLGGDGDGKGRRTIERRPAHPRAG